MRLLLPVFLAACVGGPPSDPQPEDPDTDETGGTDETDDTDEPDTDDPLDDDCAEVQTVLNDSCAGCHGSFAVDGLDLRDVTEVVGLRSRHTDLSFIEPGDSAESYLVRKVLGTHAVVGGPGVQMPPDRSAALTDAELLILTDWIDAGATCAEPPEPPSQAEYDPNTLDQDALFTCDGQPSSSPGRLRRIDKEMLRRRVGLPWGHAIAANPLEPATVAQYSTYADGAEMDVVTTDLYIDALADVGLPWRGNNVWDREALWARNKSLDCIYKDAEPSPDCIEDFSRIYLETAVVMGAVDTAEVDRLAAFAQDTLDDELASGGSRDLSITTITSAAWLHTSALFEREIGEGPADEFGRIRLSDDEAASMIGMMLSDRGPGAVGIYLYDNALAGDDRWTDSFDGHMPDLWAAGDDGTIQQPTVAAGLVRQYAMGIDPDREDEWIDYGSHSLMGQRRDRAQEWMSDKLDRFFLEWLDVYDFESGFQEAPNATTKWHDQRTVQFQRSLDEMRSYEGWNEPDGLMGLTDTIARVVTDDTHVLRNLLLTTEWYLPATGGSSDLSHQIFGLDSGVPATREGRWNTLPADERVGVLTHPVWLASHGDAFEDGPSLVHRGKWIRERLFCESVPPLELVTVEAILDDSDGTQTARQRVEASIETKEECMGCHQYMNDLGKPFEAYNHAGLLRFDEHGHAPDSSTILANAPDEALNGSYADTFEFMTALSGSEHVKRCFVRQTFRFFAGRDETLADACVLTDMETAYDESGGSFVSLIETLATHDAMMYRDNGEAK